MEMNIRYFRGNEWTNLDSFFVGSSLLVNPHKHITVSHFGSRNMTHFLVLSRSNLTGQAMCLCGAFLLVFALFLSEFVQQNMEGSKLLQRAEVRIFRIQGKSVAEAHTVGVPSWGQRLESQHGALVVQEVHCGCP